MFSQSGGTPVDPDAQAFITAAAITDPTQQSAINQLVIDLKGYGVWTKMKALYPFVGGTASQHKFNLKDPRDLDAAFRLVFNGGWTHSSNGITGNGINGYTDTKMNVSSVFTGTNNISHGAYLRIVGNGAFGLWTGETSRFDVLPNYLGLRYGAVGNNGQVTSNDLGTGFLNVSRIANNSNKIYRNGVLKNTNTATNTATSFGNTYTYCLGAGGGTTFFDTSQFAFHYIGDGLTDTEAANFYTAVQVFQTTLNRQV